MDKSQESFVLIRLPVRRASTRSVSPIRTSPLTDIDKSNGGPKLFRVLARTLGRRSQKQEQQDGLENDSRSSSTDSFYSSANKLAKGESCSSGESSGVDSGYSNSRGERFGGESGSNSGSGSDTGSDSAGQGNNEDVTRAASFRKAFQNLSISRSQSMDGIATVKPTRRQKKTAAPKKILRPPVVYTYVRGLSGLPTQRVPRNTQSRPCCLSSSPQKTR